MEERDIFDNISPIDTRYSVSEERDVFDALARYLSESASVRSCAKAEAALVQAHLAQRGTLTDEIAKQLDSIADKIDAAEVYAEEEKTHHNIRALVNVLKRKVSALDGGDVLAPLVHLGATSVDILDSAQSMRVQEATRCVVLPQLRALELSLCALTDREADTPQVGRTHGQHAVPITFGWSMAEFVSRLGKSILRIDSLSLELKGKLSGPVGAYNGMSMITNRVEELEKDYLARLNLEPSEYSNQLVEPEYLLRLLLEMNVAFGILANLADDLRNLQRSEIGEAAEGFTAAQVGSSTMPQKRNPWNSEHVKSLWKAFAPRAITFFMDQISEHQRDLTNSASSRFVADYITGFTMAAARMRRVVDGLAVDRGACARNLAGAGGRVKGGVLAEAAYILLGEAGVSDGHEVIRKITLECEKEGAAFFDVLKKHTDVYNKVTSQLEKLGIEDAAAFFSSPARYQGLASVKARALAKKYAALMTESAEKGGGDGQLKAEEREGSNL